MALVPGAVAVNELRVQHKAEVPRSERPKAGWKTRVLKDGASTAKDGLIAPLDVRVGLVDPRRRLAMREAKVIDGLDELSAVVCVDIVKVGSWSPVVLKSPVCLIGRFAFEGVAISHPSADVVNTECCPFAENAFSFFGVGNDVIGGNDFAKLGRLLLCGVVPNGPASKPRSLTRPAVRVLGEVSQKMLN